MKLQKLLPFLLICLSILPLFDLFHPGLPVTHDGQDHVARIANFYLDLQNGIIIPRWAENLNWGYGHPIVMFLYPLPSYIASLFHFIGFSLVDSTKLVFAISFILSGFAMYLWLKEFLQKDAAFVGSMLYLFAPYRFVEMYVRGDIGESLAFLFPPLILYFLSRISRRFSLLDLLFGSCSLAGLILAHNAVSIMFLPIIILYSIYLFWRSKMRQNFIIGFFGIVVLGFLLSGFFWIPAFFEGKYTLRDILTKGSIDNNFVSLQAIIYSPWNYGLSGQFSVQIGLTQWLLIIISIPLLFILWKKKDKQSILLGGSIVLFFFSIFLLLNQSRFIWEHTSLLQKFQFPWRFLSLTIFLASIIGSIVFSYLPKRLHILSLMIFVILILIVNSSYWHAKAFSQKPETFYSGVYHSTTDTGESSPIWSVRFMEHEPNSHTEIIGGHAIVHEIKRTPNEHAYIVSTKEVAVIRENTLYFPGWVASVDGKGVPIQFQDVNSRGIITFNVFPGMHKVTVNFTETRLRMFSDILSIIMFVGVISFLLVNKFIWRN